MTAKTPSQQASSQSSVVDDDILISPSATKLGEPAAGKVVVCGSHGGIYAAWLALRDNVRALILNDAGVGMNQAGIAGLDLCQQCGVPGATVAHYSCRIGDAQSMWETGIVSFTNPIAAQLGVTPGLDCATAAKMMQTPPPGILLYENLPSLSESRQVEQSVDQRDLVLIDSASLVLPEDRDQVVVCGSHGGLVGGLAHMAIQADVFAAAYNDAGAGLDDAGLTRLPALDARRIAGLTVAHTSAEIGNAGSMMKSGRISHFNQQARHLGVERDEALSDVVLRWRRL